MATQNQDRLRSHFAAHPETSHPTRWDALWAEGTFLPWDRGSANPALVDLLHAASTSTTPPTSPTPNPSAGAPSATDAIGTVTLPAPLKDGKRAKALVPGCGKGYDVALFAACGYEAYGLEVSEHAVSAAQKYLADPGTGPLEGEYAVRDDAVGRGKSIALLGDFFEDAWLKEVEGWEGGFDVIYDNTFLCALPLSLRPKWAARMVALLAPQGTLICLEFPTHKPAASGGPPWALPPIVHSELFKQPATDVQYNESGQAVSTERPDGPLVRVAHYTPARTVVVGVVNGVVRDCVSLWRHKG